MLSSKLAVGLVGVLLSSCGSGDVGQGEPGLDVLASPVVAEPSPMPTPAAHGWNRMEGVDLIDDGYVAPELHNSEIHSRLVDGRWEPIAQPPSANGASDELPLTGGSATIAQMQDTFAPPAVGSLPSGEVFVFGFLSQKLGVLHWSERAGESFTELRSEPHYADFPQSVVAISPDDVWVAASATAGDFGPDFPGCPIIIRNGQNTGTVAHFDGRRWTTLPYEATGALLGIYPREAGKVEVVAGSLFNPRARSSYVVSADGAWEKVPGRMADRAQAAGFEIDGNKVLRVRGDVREVVFTGAPPLEEGGPTETPIAVHALPNGELWLEVALLTGNETFGVAETQWWAWAE